MHILNTTICALTRAKSFKSGRQIGFRFRGPVSSKSTPTPSPDPVPVPDPVPPPPPAPEPEFAGPGPVPVPEPVPDPPLPGLSSSPVEALPEVP